MQYLSINCYNPIITIIPSVYFVTYKHVNVKLIIIGLIEVKVIIIIIHGQELYIEEGITACFVYKII